MLDPALTVMVGANGTGKSAAFDSLARLFGVTQDERRVRTEDFHVPFDEEDVPLTRELSIDVVIAFPELADEDDHDDDDGSAADTVPEFFRQMGADDDGELKCRFRLEATWTNDGSVDGTVSENVLVVHTFDTEYGEDDWTPLRPLDRARIQMIYVPAARDGARHVTAFLRGRLWRAAQWSDELKTAVDNASSTLTDEFRSEAVIETVEGALAGRWQQLHQAETDADPIFRPVDRDFAQVVGKAQLVFEPTDTGRERRADQLSDGQRSLLHIALTAATLDVEAMISSGAKEDEFDLEQARLPSLTLLVVEEPENSLSPYFLSRIILQVLEVAEGAYAQALISSHSASVLGRVDPEVVRHFRLDAERTASVNALLLPDDDDERAMYVREAVRAFPELYFARFVVLGEGSSEEVVIPLLAEAGGVVVDRSFVAVVPLGGRHVNHFWRLLAALRIPHATLLDLDRGRHGGCEGRIRTICEQLTEIGVDPLSDIEGFDDPADVKNLTEEEEIESLLAELQKYNVFFSAPLDLDMTLLLAFPDEYEALAAALPGPQQTDAFDAVLGAGGDRDQYEGWDDEMRWYRYLFLGRSKPSTHLRALSGVDADTLAANTPEPLGQLIARIAEAVN